MPGIEDIKKQIRMLDDKFAKYIERKETFELTRLIGNNERIEYIIETSENNNTGLLYCTNLRLLFVAKMLKGVWVIEFSYDRIQKVESNPGTGMFGSLTIAAPNHKNVLVPTTFEYIDKSNLKSLYDWILSKTSTGAGAEVEKPILDVEEKLSQDEVMEKLERIAKLKEMGILTDAEFAEQKKKLLDSMS